MPSARPTKSKARPGPPMAPPGNGANPAVRQAPNPLGPVVPNLMAVGLDRVVTVAGQMGVFTPLTPKPGDPSRAGSSDNVQAILASLKNEIARLQQDNLALRARLAAASTVPRSPSDFAAAVQRSLDQLQGQLASTTNPVSNFAVKQFRLETNVVLDVTALGDVIYRFPDAADRPDEHTLSRISLEVVPLPKTSTAGVFTSDWFQPDVSVAQIEGVTAAVQSLLHQNQIDTIGDLLAVGSRVRSVTELVALLKIDRNRLATWITSAQLLTLRGIDGGRATVLEAAGITTLAAMAALTADQLVKRFGAARQKSGRADVKAIAPDEAAAFIKAAAAYIGQRAVPSPMARA